VSLSTHRDPHAEEWLEESASICMYFAIEELCIILKFLCLKEDNEAKICTFGCRSPGVGNYCNDIECGNADISLPAAQSRTLSLRVRQTGLSIISHQESFEGQGLQDLGIRRKWILDWVSLHLKNREHSLSAQ
jgi:hypothetical protein